MKIPFANQVFIFSLLQIKYAFSFFLQTKYPLIALLNAQIAFSRLFHKACEGALPGAVNFLGKWNEGVRRMNEVARESTVCPYSPSSPATQRLSMATKGEDANGNHEH